MLSSCDNLKSEVCNVTTVFRAVCLQQKLVEDLSRKEDTITSLFYLKEIIRLDLIVSFMLNTYTHEK